MFDDPNQLPQMLHNAAPMVLVTVVVLIGIILFVAIADGCHSPTKRTSQGRTDQAGTAARHLPYLRRRDQRR